MRSVPTYDLGVPAVREGILERMDEVVVKPRAGHGGYGVVVGPHARGEDSTRSPRDRGRARRLGGPGDGDALHAIPPSTAGGLAPRHVDLRPSS